MIMITLIMIALLSTIPSFAIAADAPPWLDEVSLRAVQLQPERYEGQVLTFHVVGLADVAVAMGKIALYVYDMQSKPRRYHSAKTVPIMLLPAVTLDAILPYVEQQRLATVQGTIVPYDFYNMQWAFLIDTIRILDDQLQEEELILVPDSTLKTRLMKRLKKRAYASSPAGIQAAKGKAIAVKKKRAKLQRSWAEKDKKNKKEQQRLAEKRRMDGVRYEEHLRLLR